MKKTGKALSLVLSLALVVSSLTATFASATADSPTAGAKVDFGSGNTAIALIKSSTGSAVTLPIATVTYTSASGKLYNKVKDPGTATWSTSNSSIASIVTNTAVKPGATKGTATLTLNVSGEKLAYEGSDANAAGTDIVTVSGSKSITVTTYDLTDTVIANAGQTLSLGVIPTQTTSLSVNETPAYSLYTVAADSSTSPTAAAQFTEKTTGVKYDATDKSVVNIGTDGKVVAQPADKVKLTSAQIKAEDSSTSAVLQTLVVRVQKSYKAGASTTIGVTPSYGSAQTMTDDNYNVAGYDIVGNTVTMNSGAVNSIDVTGAVAISGGTVAGAVQSSGAGVTLTGGTVGAVNAVGAVSVGNATVSGNVASDSTVGVDSKGVTGAIRAKGKVTLTSGATTGAITGVPTITNPTGDGTDKYSVKYPEVSITSAVVKGDVVANKVTIDGTVRDTNNKIIPASVNGNVLLYNDSTTPAAAQAVIGTSTTGIVSVSGTVVDNDGGAAITLNQATDGSTTVGGLIGKKPTSSTDPLTTTLNLNGVTSTFASLPYFTSVITDVTSDVKVSSALTTNTLNVAGKFTAPSATIATSLTGTGTITMPAGSLIAKSGITGSLTFVPTNTVSVGTMLFKSISGQANAIKVPGVTLDEKDNGDATYSYVAKTVSFAGIKLDKSTDKVAKGYSDTIKASPIPDGQALPAGDSIKWVVADGAYITVTPSADTMSATVSATNWSDVDLGGVNEVTVTAFVVDKNGNEVYDYPEKTCAVTAIEKPEVIPAKYTSDTTTALSLKAGQQYCYKITSADGSDPTMVFGTSGVAKIVKTTVSGNAYFISVEGVKDGATGVYIGGSKTPINVITVAGTTFQYKSDTTVVTVKTGNAYTFKITADKGASAPVFQVCTFNSSKNSKETVLVNTVKNANGTTDYFYKIVATNSPKGAHGAYVNGVKVATVTVA